MPEQIVNKRKTFAIISHPDAGKTTLTEKLLLFGGAIQQAGAVKARGENRSVHSQHYRRRCQFRDLPVHSGLSGRSNQQHYPYTGRHSDQLYGEAYLGSAVHRVYQLLGRLWL